MPVYVYKCDKCESRKDHYNRIADMEEKAPRCCGQRMGIEIQAPMMATVDNMPAYECPVTGQYVTSRKQRNEIMRRHDLVEAGDRGPKDSPRP